MSESFGELLRRFRIAASLTQEALAERCRLSPATIAALEQGRRNAPRLSTVRMIAEALELPAADRGVLARAASDGAVGPERTGRGRREGAGTGRDGQRPPRAALPAAITPLFGRHAATEAVTQELAAERLVTLVGPGGVGKTRLALEAASVSLDKFPGGTFWIEFGPVSDPGLLPEAVLAALGAAEQPGVTVHDQVMAALPGERALLVLDNCEHVLDAAAALIADLLARPAVTVLATSREPLAILGEVRWQVRPLAVPAGAPASAAELGGIASVQLFAERASRADPGFAMSDGQSQAVARICRRLEGIPLAIELAAARIGVLSAVQLADELDRRIRLAASAARGVPGRHTTLQACIDWSYQLLTGQEQAAFRSLACFAGSFTAPAFAAAARHSALPEPAGSLHRLAEKSLVALDTGTGRYQVLDTIRVFAAERAAEAGEATAVQDAHAGYYASWLAGLDAAEADDDVLDAIDTDYANVRAALVWSTEAGSPRAAAIVAGMGNFWQERGRFHDARVLGDAALRTAEGRDPALWARAVAALANARLLGGDLAFLTAVSRARAIAADAGDRRTQGWCQMALGTRPPFDGALLVSAHLLGCDGPWPTLAALAGIFLAYGGTEPDREGWLRRAAEFGDGVGNATVQAAWKIAWADTLVERGRLAEALDLAVPPTFDPEVMPTVRLLGIGRTLQVAFHRHDHGLARLAAEMSQELSGVWPAGGPWLTSSWTAFGNMLQMWSGLLRGELAPAPDLRTLGRVTRMVLTPSAVRTICRAALDRGDRLNPADVAMATAPPAAGSLMAASLAAVEAAYAALDDDAATAARWWSEVLSTAAAHEYLLLVCDGLEGLGCLAARDADPGRAGRLLSAARQCRADIAYRHRFRYEQELLDRASAGIGSAADAAPSLPWRDAVAVALRP